MALCTKEFEMKKKLILVLTADVGFGHRSAANAVAAAIRDRYGEECEAVILNPLEDKRAPFFLRDSGADYDRTVRSMPEFYRFYYDASDTTVTSAIVESSLTVLLFEIMLDIVRIYHPDAIVSTYPLYQAPLQAVFTMRGQDTPLLLVVTDLATVHRIWFNREVEACLVANTVVRDLGLNYGMMPEQIVVTGIPVNPMLMSDQRTPQMLRRDLGWTEEVTTFLAVGSRRVDRLLGTLNVLNHFGIPLQLVVVAGNDFALYKELQKIEWHVPNHMYKYVENIPEMMRAADAVICKAGGLIVTEALATGRPLMLVDAIPGQEEGNADFVVRGGAGDLARTDDEVLETTAHWLMDKGKILEERARNAAKMGRPNAAYEVAEQAYIAARRGPTKRNHFFSRKTLIDLFRRNHVRWGDSRDLKTPEVR
jgi:1,2-diacylglycerol 3-beta-galactosyltransferase